MIGAVFAAHIDGLAAQGSFDDDVRVCARCGCGQCRAGDSATGSTVQAAVAFDERLDALVPVSAAGRGIDGQRVDRGCPYRLPNDPAQGARLRRA